MWSSAGIDEDALLALAASAERPSEHPVSQAILSAAQERGLPISEARRVHIADGLWGQRKSGR